MIISTSSSRVWPLSTRTVNALIWVTSWRAGSGSWRISAAGSTGCTMPAAQTHLTWTSRTTSSCCGSRSTSSSTSSSPACSSPSWLVSSSISPQTLVCWHGHQDKKKNWRKVALCFWFFQKALIIHDTGTHNIHTKYSVSFLHIAYYHVRFYDTITQHAASAALPVRTSAHIPSV